MFDKNKNIIKQNVFTKLYVSHNFDVNSESRIMFNYPTYKILLKNTKIMGNARWTRQSLTEKLTSSHFF